VRMLVRGARSLRVYHGLIDADGHARSLPSLVNGTCVSLGRCYCLTTPL
jgi:hypothetical protein